jgi:hypothetical protein
MPKQTQLPGTEEPSFPDIEEAADQYVSIRDKRMVLTTKEVEAKTKLMDVMRAHQKDLSVTADGDACYRFDNEIVILTEKANVKVKNANDDADEDED